MIVSWQAPHTLGRRLADREPQVKIFGKVYRRRAEIATIGGLSAHGGQQMLVEYAEVVKEQVQKVFLVHGEERGALPLIEKLKGIGISEAYFPDAHTSVEI